MAAAGFSLLATKFSPLTREQLVDEFIAAARDNDLSAMFELYTFWGVDVNATNDPAITALDCAAKRGHHEIIRWLLDHGATTADKKYAYMTAEERVDQFVFAAWDSNLAAMIELHTIWGVDVNATGIALTALGYAAHNGHCEMIRWLLDHGATVDGREDDSPLALACSEGHFEAADMLFNAGADINHIGDGTPLHRAALNNNTAAVRWLLERGANPTLKGKGPWHEDKTPLQACKVGSECSTLLSDAIASNTWRDNDAWWRRKHATIIFSLMLDAFLEGGS